MTFEMRKLCEKSNFEKNLFKVYISCTKNKTIRCQIMQKHLPLPFNSLKCNYLKYILNCLIKIHIQCNEV